MESLQRYRAMEAFCRQHAKMDGESESFWLEEADSWKRRLRRSVLYSWHAEDCLKRVGNE